MELLIQQITILIIFNIIILHTNYYKKTMTVDIFFFCIKSKLKQFSLTKNDQY